MRNHLYRLAAHLIAGGGPRLHPMLGSIYAPLASPREIETSDTATIATATVAAPPRQVETTATIVTPNVAPPPTGASRDGAISGEPPAVAKVYDFRRFRDSEGTLFPPLPVSSFATEVRAEPDSPSPTPSAEVRVLQSQVSDNAFLPQPRAQHVPLPTAVTNAILRRGPEQSPRAVSREADEVYIHIGRIEVTAAPPSPRPVVAPPARKTMTLDEYLQRSNARRT